MITLSVRFHAVVGVVAGKWLVHACWWLDQNCTLYLYTWLLLRLLVFQHTWVFVHATSHSLVIKSSNFLLAGHQRNKFVAMSSSHCCDLNVHVGKTLLIIRYMPVLLRKDLLAATVG